MDKETPKVESITKGRKAREITASEIRSSVITKMLAWVRDSDDKSSPLLAAKVKPPVPDQGLDPDELNKLCQMPVYWPLFPHNYALYMPDGTRSGLPVVVSEDKVLTCVDIEEIQNETLNYYMTKVRPMFFKAGLKDMAYSQACEIVKHWRSRWTSSNVLFKPLSSVAPVAFRNDPHYCWSRLSFDPKEHKDEPTPTYDEFLSRFSGNQEAFMTWVGKIFIPGSYRTQCPWIKGVGRDTKSSFMAVLKWALSDVCVLNAQVPNQNNERFWPMGHILGKRLVIFPDFDKYGWIKSGSFRTLTGDDYCHGEIKGKGAAFQIKNDAFFVFMSNVFPAVLNMKAIRRRMILIEIDTYEGPMLSKNEIENRLKQEFPAFLYKCLELAKQYPGEIPTNDDVLDDLIDKSEAKFIDMYEKWFRSPGKRGPEQRISTKDFRRAANIMYPKGAYSFEQFFETRHKKVRRARVKTSDGEKVTPAFEGVMFTPYAEQRMNQSTEPDQF